MVDVTFCVNGRELSADVPSSTTLADFLRDDLHLTGCRVSCDSGVCGSCTVLVDGSPVAACSTFVFEVDKSSIETIEGLTAPDGRLHPIQQAFLQANAFQCGFCTSGFILSVKALLETHPSPDEVIIREWLKANICRCTGYKSIIEATRLAGAVLEARVDAQDA
jgi:aerobic-type carbon monoxide dehydrogenase small subunit (CoxS/CutS family)